MKTSEQTAEIFKAFSEFRKVLKQPLKDANNPFFKSKYVPLENVVEVIDEAIEGTGLSYSQEATSEGNYISVATHVFHESGQFISFDPLSLPATKADAQGFGSAVTYAKRYALSAVFGITSDQDDDGNATSGNNAPKNANEEQISVAKMKMKELAEANGMDANETAKMVLDYLKIKVPLDKTNNEEIGQVLRYLNEKIKK
ncbi:ERF family protein [Enterococcus asini]|uniref:ERF family protein n=1 Tax=Enterococcus asini TaxID=57732 RepID=UPI000900293D|nr:ERF family protein [Enterococcus asini]